jgi:hypothetical protein
MARVTLTLLVIGCFSLEINSAPAQDDKTAAELQALRDELKRNRDEIKALQASIKKREAQILELEAQVRQYKNQAIANETMLKATLLRIEQMLSQINDLTRRLAGKDGGKDDPQRDAAANPPTTYVKGTILKLGNEGLMEISLGSDHGIARGNTLEVFRLEPRPEYLGMIRIVDLRYQTSIGRMVKMAPGKKEIKAGDIVASSLTSEK